MAFVENPLSLSVSQPAFEAWLEGDTSQSAANPGRNGASRPSARSSGTREMALTLDDLTKGPVKWTDEFFAFDKGLDGYSWPGSFSEAQDKLARNSKNYTGNYLILVALVAVCMLYKRPWALLGTVLIIAAFERLRAVSWQEQLHGKTLLLKVLRISLQISVWVAMLFFRLAVAAAQVCLISTAIVVLHGCLKKPSPMKPLDQKGKKR